MCLRPDFQLAHRKASQAPDHSLLTAQHPIPAFAFDGAETSNCITHETKWIGYYFKILCDEPAGLEFTEDVFAGISRHRDETCRDRRQRVLGAGRVFS